MRQVGAGLSCWVSRGAACSVLLVACGGQARIAGDPPPTSNVSGASGASDGSGGGAPGGSEGAIGGTSGMPACPVAPAGPPAPVSGPPPFACAEGVNGVWVEVPCGCELWLRNPVAEPLQVSISLDYTPSSDPPSIASSPDVELAIPDPDASWYHASATDIDPRIALSYYSGVATARLGVSSAKLPPLTLAGCARLSAKATVNGPWGTARDLTMTATMRDANGEVVTTSSGECYQPESHPTIANTAAGAAGAAGAPR